MLGGAVAQSGCTGGPSKASGMNVMVIIIDSLRKDHVGAYGNEWIKTPNLDALAKESMRFTRAYPESMPTINARRAIHTGLRTWPFEVNESGEDKKARCYGWAPIPENQTTLSEILQEQGYETALVTDTYVQFPRQFGRGFDTYRKIRGQERDPYKPLSLVTEKEMQNYLPILESETRQYLANTQERKTEEDWFAPKVFLGAAQLLEKARQKKPFFMVADCFDPHEPWDPPQKYSSLYDKGYDGPEPFTSIYGADDYLTDRQLQRMRSLYAGEVTMVDRWLGNFLERAHDLGIMDNTVLVLLSDHGHALGEHGFTGKPAYALWPELTDIVFFVRHPEGKGAGQTSDYYASTHDVAPTILGMLGIDPPSPMEGQDLSVLLDGKAPEPRPHFTLAFHRTVWTRDDRYVMFGRDNGTDAKLYDVQADPKQENNLAADNPEIVERMLRDYVLGDAGGSLSRCQ